MNILPIVLIFLTIFSYIAVTFLKELKSMSCIEKSLDGFERTDRALNNNLSQRVFRKIKTAPTTKTATSSSSVKKVIPFSKREMFPPLELSKFNLVPLLKCEGTQEEHPLYKPLIQLIRLLYQERLFAFEKKPETLAATIVNAILKQAKKVSDPLLLCELHPDDPYLQGLYYKMLKGTNNYTMKKGIPPLDHFLTLDDATKTAICVTFASTPLLSALFGEKIARAIEEFEKKKCEETGKSYYFSKQDLQTIYQTPMLSLLEPYLSEAKTFEKRETIGAKDMVSGIALEKVL